MAFNDEFNGTSLNTANFTPCFDWNSGSCTSSFNNGKEHYDPGQVQVSGGTAKLVAQPLSPALSDGSCYQSSCTYKAGLIATSRPNQSSAYLHPFTYGYIESRMKYPAVSGMFTAFWMLPDDPTYNYQNEIDIAEILGGDPDTIFMTDHYGVNRGTDYPINTGDHNNGACAVQDYSTSFVTLGMDWEPTYLAWYINGVKCGQFNGNSSTIESGPMQIILHMMVDNDWERSAGLTLANQTIQAQLEVDYLRVYQQVDAVAPSAFPDATNTGTPAGVTLHDCALTIDVGGSYDSCRFPGAVRITAPGVTITRSLINGQVTGPGDTLQGAVISDTTIDCGCLSIGANDTPFAIENDAYTLTRVNIFNMGGGASAGTNVTIQDSWIHGQGNATESHKGGIYSGGGTNSVYRHNNVECDDGALGCTDAIGFLSDFGDSTYYVVDDNLMNTTGAACFYGSGSTAKPYAPNHLTVSNNHFGRKYHDTCGLYAPVSFFDVNAVGNVWTNNVWDDTGLPVPPAY
jgi:hypothetical protein